MTNKLSYSPGALEFLQEFYDLLVKYSAYIDFSVGEGSDTHGLYDERMNIQINHIDTIASFPGWNIDRYHLKRAIEQATLDDK